MSMRLKQKRGLREVDCWTNQIKLLFEVDVFQTSSTKKSAYFLVLFQSSVSLSQNRNWMTCFHFGGRKKKLRKEIV